MKSYGKKCEVITKNKKLDGKENVSGNNCGWFNNCSICDV
jgi:hypothetical protein